MTQRLCALFVILVLALPVCLADTLVLKNGDRLTGQIIESDGKALTLKTDYAGTLKIQWEAIEQITSSQPLYLALSDGQTLVGSVAASAGQFEVSTSKAGKVSVNRETVQTVRSEEAEKSYQAGLERLRNPSLLDLWSGTADAGLSLAQGNAETTALSLAVNAERTTPRDKIGVTAASLYSTNSTTGTSLTTANAIRGGARYEMNISRRSYAFGTGSLEFDEFQKLDLRMTLGGGLGWHAYKTDRTTFDILGGGAYTKEYFSTGLKRSSGELIVGQELTHNFSGRSSIKQRLTFLPNMSDTGEFRLNFDISAVTNLNTWLGFHVTLSDRYLSNPLPGIKNNDLLLSTGLRLIFGKQ